jgi:hypothetical protein
MTDSVSIPALPETQMPLEAQLTAWHTAVNNANYWKAEEMRLRKQIFSEAFPSPVIGTNKIRLPHAMALVAKYKLNYKLDRAGLEAARSLIKPEIFDAVVSYSPSLKDAAYRDLPGDDRKLFASFVTETPGAPDLEIVPASKVRW